MPKIRTAGESDSEKVIQALECQSDRGPFLQVGGVNIDPGEIISFSGPRESATFQLSDGRTVQNDRFLAGDVGDLLFDALQVLRRPGKKTQAIKPALNRSLLGPGINQVADAQGNGVQNLNAPGGDYHYFDLDAQTAFGSDGNGNIFIYDWGQGNAQTLDPTGSTGDTSDIVSVVPDRGQTLLYFLYVDATNFNWNLGSVNYDGTNLQVINQDAATDWGDQIGLDAEQGLIFGASQSALFKIPVDGSTATNIASTNDLGKTTDVNPDSETVLNWGTNRQTRYDYNGNQLSNQTNWTTPGAFGAKYFDGSVYVVEGNKVKKTPPDSYEPETLFTAGSNIEGIDVGLDLDAI